MRKYIFLLLIMSMTLLSACGTEEITEATYMDYTLTKIPLREKVTEVFGSGDWEITVNNSVDGKIQCTLEQNNPFGEGPDILRTKALFAYDYETNEISTLKEFPEDIRVFDYIYVNDVLYYSTVEATKDTQALGYLWKVYQIKEKELELLDSGVVYDDLKTPVFGWKKDGIYYLSENINEKENLYECAYNKISGNKIKKVIEHSGKMEDYYLDDTTWYYTNNELSRTGQKYSFVFYQKDGCELYYYDKEKLQKAAFEEKIDFQYDLGNSILVSFAGDDVISIFDKATKEVEKTKNRNIYYCGAYVSPNAIIAYTEFRNIPFLLWAENGELKTMKIENPQTKIPHFFYLKDDCVLFESRPDYYVAKFFKR